MSVDADWPLIDAHVHVYPASAWGRRRTHDHAIQEYGTADVHYPTGQTGTIDDVVDTTAVAGLSHAVVLNLFEPHRWRADVEEKADGLSEQLRISTTPGQYLVDLNDWLCTAAISRPQLLPVIAIDPTALAPQELADHVEHFVRERGAAGVKLHPILQRVWPHDARLNGVWELCADLQVPAVIHSGVARAGPQFAAPAAFETLATSFPRLRAVIAHLGGAAWRETVVVAKRHPGFWFDCSEMVSWLGAPRAPRLDEFVRTVRAVGVERVLYGSDYPWYAPADGIRRLREMNAFSPSERELILGANAAHVFSRALASNHRRAYDMSRRRN